MEVAELERGGDIYLLVFLLARVGESPLTARLQLHNREFNHLILSFWIV